MDGPHTLYKQPQLFVFLVEHGKLAKDPREPTGLPKPEALGPDEE